MSARRARFVSLGLAGALLTGLLTVLPVAPQEAVAADDPTPVVPSQSLGTAPPQQTEEAGKPLPAPEWPQAAQAAVDLSGVTPGEPGVIEPGQQARSAAGEPKTSVANVVEVSPVAEPSTATTEESGAEPQTASSRVVAEESPSPSPSDSASGEPGEDAAASPTPSDAADPSETPSDPPAESVSPDKVDVRVLDRQDIKPAGGVGLGLQVTRADGGTAAGEVQVDVDYSKFKYAFGGDFAGRLRLVKMPACALSTPEAEGCTEREFVEADNDTKSGTLTATVEAAPDAGEGTSTQLVDSAGASVYVLASGSSSDQGDYRASTLSATGSWDVSTGSGAFTYSYPFQLPKPPMGSAPPLALDYNSQSVDGRTSASNNQASWVGMGWDLNVGYIERRYRNCSQDGLPTIGDLCWDSPNSAKEPSGAVYVINLNGVTRS
ncbi:hypothetical protein ACIBI4_09075 [Streptomyces sp. NPDC050418]|uniref:hypothetical protein n=1 Tax=Streptomyces sp. NPDC050418 TaxID=3365612 RepID=UPI0037A8854F